MRLMFFSTETIYLPIIQSLVFMGTAPALLLIVIALPITFGWATLTGKQPSMFKTIPIPQLTRQPSVVLAH